jgi:hypothetical protein
MLNGWSFNWESMATREKEGLGDALGRRLACCLYLCVLSVSGLSLIVARDSPFT